MQGGPAYPSLGYFPGVFSLLASLISHLFVLLRTLAFCVHLNWQQWERKWPSGGKRHLACFGKKKTLLTLMWNFSSYLWGWNCTSSSPVWGVQELLFPLALAGSDRTCTKSWVTSLSTTSWRCWCVWQRNWESLALLCSTSITHDITLVMSLASDNIRDISWCAGADSITGRSPSRGSTPSTGLYCC